MAELVSPCCGAEYTDVDEHVSSCCEAIFHDPGWPDNDICSKCKEHTDSYEYICENCDESFEEPEVDYEMIAVPAHLVGTAIAILKAAKII